MKRTRSVLEAAHYLLKSANMSSGAVLLRTSRAVSAFFCGSLALIGAVSLALAVRDLVSFGDVPIAIECSQARAIAERKGPNPWVTMDLTLSCSQAKRRGRRTYAPGVCSPGGPAVEVGFSGACQSERRAYTGTLSFDGNRAQTVVKTWGGPDNSRLIALTFAGLIVMAGAMYLGFERGRRKRAAQAAQPARTSIPSLSHPALPPLPRKLCLSFLATPALQLIPFVGCIVLAAPILAGMVSESRGIPRDRPVQAAVLVLFVAFGVYQSFVVLRKIHRDRSTARDGAYIEASLSGSSPVDELHTTYRFRMEGGDGEEHVAVLENPARPLFVGEQGSRVVAIRSRRDPNAFLLLQSDLYPLEISAEERERLCASEASFHI